MTKIVLTLIMLYQKPLLNVTKNKLIINGFIHQFHDRVSLWFKVEKYLIWENVVINAIMNGLLVREDCWW